MPNIFDNIENILVEGLCNYLDKAQSCAFCVGYLNLRGWQQVADAIEHLQGGDEEHACRVLLGMHRPPEEDMRLLQSLCREEEPPDGPMLAQLKEKITQSFKEQLAFGIPTNEAEATLRALARQLRARKVYVKAFLRYPLHAKLYLVRRHDNVTPLIGFVGSSNLTLAGLKRQGELNVDVVEQDAAQKLLRWFDQRWNDDQAFDLTDELASQIEKSWAGEKLVRPYHVYLKIAYHLSEEARLGESEYKMPKIMEHVLLDFQKAAVSLAVRYLHRRGGVLLGDVVGLGKTLMATAIARLMQEDQGCNTLVICPPKLVPLWQHHLEKYEIVGRVLSLGKVISELPQMQRYRLVIIDESHNLRERDGERYRVIRNYIRQNEPHVVLVTATPYNKHFTDLSNQLRLFVDEDRDLSIRPEQFFAEWARQGLNEADFIARFQTTPRSLRAFEQSNYPDDWQDLMRLFLVRRTRQFIMRHYAQFDEQRQRYFVTLNGDRHYFPIRQPKRIDFPVDQKYSRLLQDDVVKVVEHLILPRYGLANFLMPSAEKMAQVEQKRILQNLNRAGKRLIGFCRTNLYKRLESSGASFLRSVERHILRNLVTLYALENQLPVPIGTQDAAMLDAAVTDADEEFFESRETDETETPTEIEHDGTTHVAQSLAEYEARAQQIYASYRNQLSKRFKWLDAEFFQPNLRKALEHDAKALWGVLEKVGTWNPKQDKKLQALVSLLKEHGNEKVLVFTQFADTARYLAEEMASRGLTDLDVITSDTPDPVGLARRFSPSVNGGLRDGERELRILIATDVLSEGQNLQDCHIVVNYDLPWAIIRLIQRAGRVDRIGQKHDTILVYSFLPDEGVERIIRLRARLFRRLQENQEVIGTDESFFGENAAEKLRDLYTEKAGVLDDDPTDEDIDIASLAFQVWNGASAEDQKQAKNLPPVVSATRALPDTVDRSEQPPGVIAYLRYPDGTDALIRVDEQGNIVSQSLSAIFRAAACPPDTPPLPRSEWHYKLLETCVKILQEEQTTLGGQLGTLRSVRRRMYEELNRYRTQLRNTPIPSNTEESKRLEKVIDAIYRYPLKSAAEKAIRRQMQLGIQPDELLELAWQKLEENILCEIQQLPAAPAEPQIICSMGLVQQTERTDP